MANSKSLGDRTLLLDGRKLSFHLFPDVNRTSVPKARELSCGFATLRFTTSVKCTSKKISFFFLFRKKNFLTATYDCINRCIMPRLAQPSLAVKRSSFALRSYAQSSAGKLYFSRLILQTRRCRALPKQLQYNDSSRVTLRLRDNNSSPLDIVEESLTHYVGRQRFFSLFFQQSNLEFSTLRSRLLDNKSSRYSIVKYGRAGQNGPTRQNRMAVIR